MSKQYEDALELIENKLQEFHEGSGHSEDRLTSEKDKNRKIIGLKP